MFERFFDLYRGEHKAARPGFKVVMLSFLFGLLAQFFCMFNIVVVLGIRSSVKLLQRGVQQPEVRIVVTKFVSIFQCRGREGMVEGQCLAVAGILQ